jgi:hypothetical protein
MSEKRRYHQGSDDRLASPIVQLHPLWLAALGLPASTAASPAAPSLAPVKPTSPVTALASPLITGPPSPAVACPEVVFAV